MKDRHIIEYEPISKKPIKQEQGRLINEKLGLNKTKENKYKFQISMRTKYDIVIYDYTNDNYINNDFILGTYKVSHTHDDQGKDKKLNAVLIPIEKFVKKY